MAGQLVQEAGFADARLTLDQDDHRGAGERVGQLTKFALSSHERHDAPAWSDNTLSVDFSLFVGVCL
jgi:hypothetical protein